MLLGLGLSLPTFGKDGKKALLIENGQIIAHTGQLGLLEFGEKKIGVLLDDEIKANAAADEVPDIYINLVPYPYCFKGLKNRIRFLSEMTVDLGVPLVSVNQVGGNGELIFDGSSMALIRMAV